MNKPLLLATILLLFVYQATSQKDTEDFTITLPTEKITNSFYNRITYVDSRYDRTNMGIVQLGAFNRKVKVVPTVLISEQLNNVINALTDSSAKNDELIFLMKQFNFAEVTGAMSEKGYCYMRASLFAKSNEAYKRINSIDTVILIKSMDVTRALFRNGSKVITEFIAQSLVKEPESQEQYSFEDILNIDSIEKNKIALYTAASLTDGIYDSYESFKNQAPDKKVEAELKNDKISSIKAINDNGEKEKVKPKEIYAVVYSGKPFIATDKDFYPLTKKENDFVFTGKAKVTANSGDVIAASIFFGVIGGLIASNAEATFEMKIDHVSGGFIRLREIKR